MSAVSSPPIGQTCTEQTQIFQTLLEQFFGEHRNLEGQVVQGVVVSLDKDMALIDVGLKSEGRVALKEFLPQKLNVGDQVEVYIERYEGPQGDVQLSHERARQEAAWHYLTDAFKMRKAVDGVIVNQVKGGLMVNIRGTMAFLPGSQVDIRPVMDLSRFIGSTQQFIVLKMDDSRSNVVVSRRAVLEESRASGRQHLLATLEQGKIVEGVVKNLTDYGAFVDLGGIDGLLHVTDIAWKHVARPSDALEVGQAIRVMVTRFNKETQRISLGLKQLERDPWVNIEQRYKVSDRMAGTVTKVTEYGAFVELDEGLEGLVHVSDMVWCKKNADPKQVVSVGQRVETMILEIDPTKRRISLGMKQCTENPLERFAAKYPVGTQVEGEVQDVTEFGVLVKLPEGVNGTIHVADLSWESDSEILSHYHAGQRIKIKVLSVNPAKEMIGLGVKQLSDDPWMDKCGHLRKGQSVKVVVRRVMESALEVELLDVPGVTTLIGRNELSRDRAQQNTSAFQVGQEIDAKLTLFNPESRNLALSIKAQEMDEERQVLADLGGEDEKSGSSLGSLVEKALGKQAEK
jgi:small subunit ribosomal protein S1